MGEEEQQRCIPGFLAAIKTLYMVTGNETHIEFSEMAFHKNKLDVSGPYALSRTNWSFNHQCS